MKSHLFLPLAAASLVLGSTVVSAALLIDENFDSYSDGPLIGQGDWVRAANFDNPSDNIQVSGGAAYFHWTGLADSFLHGARLDWGGEALTSGSVFATFDLRVIQAPADSENLRPSFFTFVSSNGAQERGHVGLKAGSEPDTFQIGVSSSSQAQSAFAFSSENLNINETYQVMVEYQINPGGSSIAQLWLNTTDPLDAPLTIAAAASSAANIRRVNLRMNTADGSGGVTDLGIFTVDNLQVTTVPEPSRYALFFGAAALLFLGFRRRYF